ncbi:MAG TPA: MmgE/PrpD family protein [Symbiobacteriaceae bacterium]|nr:MmgE/PrpD family protein [Symbiobacteriaceae bacterium]
MSATQVLAKWATELRWEDVPAATRDKAKQCLMEFFSCCLVARDEEPGRLLAMVLKGLGGNAQASIIGRPEKLSVEQAALVNGALGHVWEIDDTHRQTMSHPGDSVIPAALAVGEWLGSDPVSVLTAIVAGYEVAVRVCASVLPSHLNKGWHPSGTTNTFGAAAAAGKLLGLTQEEMASAFGLATTQASGTFCHLPEMAMTKDLNPGKAAANGVLSALLAQAGFTGSPTALENRRGFLSTHADGGDLTKVTTGLGATFAMDQIAFKPYSACRHAHASIDAMLALREEHGLTEEMISKIKIVIYPMAATLINNPDPIRLGFYGTRYSVHFNVALALLAGAAGMQRALFDQEYGQAMVRDKEINKVMAKTEVEVDPRLGEGWPDKWPAKVVVTLTDGAVLERLVEYPLGEPERPMQYSQLVGKMQEAAKGYLTEVEVEHVVETIQSLEKLRSVRDLMQLVSKGSTAGGEARG